MTNKRLPIRLVRGRSRTNGTWSSRRNAGLERTGQLACFHRERGYHVGEHSNQVRAGHDDATTCSTDHRCQHTACTVREHIAPHVSTFANRAYERIASRPRTNVRAYRVFARRGASAPIITVRTSVRAYRTSTALQHRSSRSARAYEHRRFKRQDDHHARARSACQHGDRVAGRGRRFGARCLTRSASQPVSSVTSVRPLYRPAHGLGAGSLAICRSARCNAQMCHVASQPRACGFPLER